MLAVCLEAAIPVGKEGMASGRPVTSELSEEQASRAVNPSASKDCRILMKWTWRRLKYLVPQYPLLRRH